MLKSSMRLYTHTRNRARPGEYDLDVVENPVHIVGIDLDHEQKLSHSIQTVEPGRQPRSRAVAVLAGMVPDPDVMRLCRGQGA